MGFKKWAKKAGSAAGSVANTAIDAGKNATQIVYDTTKTFVPPVADIEKGVIHAANEMPNEFEKIRMGAEVAKVVNEKGIGSGSEKRAYDKAMDEYKDALDKIEKGQAGPITANFKTDEKKKSLLGRAGTILTGSQGVMDRANVRKKSLLGQ